MRVFDTSVKVKRLNKEALQLRNAAYLTWLTRANDIELVARVPVLEISPSELEEKYRPLYRKHLEMWLSAHETQ